MPGNDFPERETTNFLISPEQADSLSCLRNSMLHQPPSHVALPLTQSLALTGAAVAIAVPSVTALGGAGSVTITASTVTACNRSCCNSV